MFSVKVKVVISQIEVKVILHMHQQSIFHHHSNIRTVATGHSSPYIELL